MTPAQVYPLIEGLAGIVPSNASQVFGDWIVAVKQILRGHPHRTYTDYIFHGLSDIDEDGSDQTNVTGGPMKVGISLYGLLVKTLSENVDLFEWVVAVDADTNTLAGENALANGTVMALRIPAVTVSGTAEFSGVIWPQPIPLGTGLTICADGVDGTGPAANAISGWVLYRATGF